MSVSSCACGTSRPRRRAISPPASRFLQIAFRTGVAIPSGNISAATNDAMSNDFGPQVPLLLELGVKVHPMIFLGAYGGPSFGWTGSDFSNAQCGSGSSRSCLGADWRVGLEVQVHFLPAERFNPWIGYGLGFEAASAWASGGGGAGTGINLTGFELGRFAVGMDVRLSRYFGFGPFIGVDFGSYSHEHLQGTGGSVDGSIANTSLHEWTTLGVRAVLFP